MRMLLAAEGSTATDIQHRHILDHNALISRVRRRLENAQAWLPLLSEYCREGDEEPRGRIQLCVLGSHSLREGQGHRNGALRREKRTSDSDSQHRDA